MTHSQRTSDARPSINSYDSVTTKTAWHVLAQFIASYNIGRDEFHRLDVTLATESGSPQKNPIQLYIVYRPSLGDQPNQYYYLIDRKMKSSWPLLNAGLYGDEQMIPHNYLPRHLVADESDAFSYFGELDPLQIQLRDLKTETGFLLRITRYSLHGPKNLIDKNGNPSRVVGYLKTSPAGQYEDLLESLLYRSAYYPTGSVVAEDLLSPEARASQITQQALELFQRRGDLQFNKAVDEVFALAAHFVERGAQFSCERLLNRIKSKIERPNEPRQQT